MNFLPPPGKLGKRVKIKTSDNKIRSDAGTVEPFGKRSNNKNSDSGADDEDDVGLTGVSGRNASWLPGAKQA